MNNSKILFSGFWIAVGIIFNLSLAEAGNFCGKPRNNTGTPRKTQLNRIPRLLSEFSRQNPSDSELEWVTRYLAEFTLEFQQKHYLEKNLQAFPFQNEESDLGEEITCSACFLYANDDSISLKCGHSIHRECFLNGINAYLREEKLNSLITCYHGDCNYKISPAELASVMSEPEQALAIQKLFVRSMKAFKFCPACGDGIAKLNWLMNYNSQCQECHQELCFSCGRRSHPGFHCEAFTDKGSIEAFIQDLIDRNESNSYGMCPHCKILVGFESGCPSMVCGQNAFDKTPLGKKGRIAQLIDRYTQDRGCGKKFEWDDRISLKDYLAQISRTR